jgi:hypothetical protein
MKCPDHLPFNPCREAFIDFNKPRFSEEIGVFLFRPRFTY